MLADVGMFTNAVNAERLSPKIRATKQLTNQLMNRSKIIIHVSPGHFGASKWVVTNGYRWVGIFRFKSDAARCLANLKAPDYWIQRGSR
jgi:hypothetical protein